jgi:amphi-Trp domain-containing protein
MLRTSIATATVPPPRSLAAALDASAAGAMRGSLCGVPRETVQGFLHHRVEGGSMDLFEIDDTQRMRREEAAARLHALAEALARNNVVQFERDGRRITVQVPDEVDLKIEVELGDENELEVELTW